MRMMKVLLLDPQLSALQYGIRNRLYRWFRTVGTSDQVACNLFLHFLAWKATLEHALSSSIVGSGEACQQDFEI